MSWPWGAYLGDDALEERHPREDLVVAARSPNVIPHVSKAIGGLHATRCSRQRRRTTPATTRRSCSTGEGTRRRRLGREHLRRARRRALHARPATGILAGITRDTIIQLADEQGYTVVEKALIRSDLYLADEAFFMCGTAAEVTPLRSVDDHEIGVGEVTRATPERVSRHGARQEAPVRALARLRARAGAWVTRRRRNQDDQPLRAVDRRARRGARARGAALGGGCPGSTGPRFESLLAEAIGAPYCAAVSLGTAGRHLCMRLAGSDRATR